MNLHALIEASQASRTPKSVNLVKLKKAEKIHQFPLTIKQLNHRETCEGTFCTFLGDSTIFRDWNKNIQLPIGIRLCSFKFSKVRQFRGRLKH